MTALLLIVGLVLLVAGADFLVRGASALAERAGVPPLVVGLTVVAFGTSTPEVVVNVMSAAQGQTGLAFGNIVGSCAINIGFVLGLTALIRPLAVEPSIITREIPMLLLSVAAAIAMSLDRVISGAAIDVLVRGDGIVLLLLFCVFLYYTIRGALARRATDPLIAEVRQVVAEEKVRPLWVDVLNTFGGLIGVGIGGRITVIGAVGVAQALAIPDAVVGFTIVSLGTTLPELTTGILAARRGQSDIALGNVVGSCIYNLLFIGGMVATIQPVAVPNGGRLDLLIMAALAAALFPLSLTGPRVIRRVDGAILLIGYLAYAIYRAAAAIAA